MGYLDRFFEDVFQQSPAFKQNNSFTSASKEQMAAHLEVDTYDAFQLTQAVRPAMDLKIKPSQGYRHDFYEDEDSQSKIPVVMAAASRDKLFDVFMQLIQRLGPVVDVVLETSHDSSEGGHADLYREHIDMPVLTSILWGYEDLLTNDGCTGIAVLNPNTPQEIQFDEHKLLIMYGSPLEQFEHVLEINGVRNNAGIRFITEAEHIHTSSDEYLLQFNELRTDLGLDGSQSQGQTHEDFGADDDDGFCV